MPKLSSGALRRRERFDFLAIFQHAGDGCDRSTRFDGGGTGDARNQRLAEFLRVAQIRIGLDERFLFHVQIIAEEEVGANGRWRAYTYDEISARDTASLDIFWLKDESLEDADNLPAPDVLAVEIVEDLEAALEQFREIAVDLGEGKSRS